MKQKEEIKEGNEKGIKRRNKWYGERKQAEKE
jgi:hypothetical protein